MSDVEADDAPRSGRLFSGLFWAGVGLAPLAGLVLLLGSDGMVRFAAVLALLSVVLIGLSITLRPDASAVRVEMEETLLEEIDMLREDVRDDIATAARATHQAFDERVLNLQRTVEALRAELEAVRAGQRHQGAAGMPPPAQPQPAMAVAAAAVPPPPPPAAGPPPAGPQHAPPGVANGRAQPVPGGPPGQGPPSRHGPHPAGDTYVAASADPNRAAAAGRAHVPAGVFRHTETVHHVTTRSTFVDRDETYQGHDPIDNDQGWTVTPPRHEPPADDGEESWTDQKLRERYGSRSRAARDDDGDARWSGGGRRRRWEDDEPEHPEPERTRWAAMHGDERGGELRMGERRAAMHTSDAGTEMRIEDRWAAVRRDWDRDGPGDQWDREAPGGHWGWDRGAGPPADRRDRPEPPRREPRALPSAEEVPSWNAGWEEPAPPRGRRRRADDEPGGGYQSGHHRLDFERSDERWR